MGNMKKIVLSAIAVLSLLNIFLISPAISAIPKTSKESEVRSYNLKISKKYNARKYFLGPNDILSIDVFGAEEFKQESVKIQPDGNVLIRPFEPINASGQTIDELQSFLTKKYNFYIKNPKVSIRLIESRPSIVYITGNVLNPGSYEVTTDSKSNGNFVTNARPETSILRKAPLLTNILVAAGGLKFDSDIEHIKVRNDLDNSEFEINLLDLIDKSDTSQDIYMMPGDNIYIPKLSSPLAVDEEKFKKYAGATFSPKEMPVKVLGYVNAPGIVKLDPSQNTDLMAAISAAGGFSGGEGVRADSGRPPSKIYLRRSDENGKMITRIVNPMTDNITILPNDIIYVPDKLPPQIGRVFDFISRLFGPAFTYSNTVNSWDIMLKR